MIRYTTVAKEAMAEQVIDRSRFIARVKPVSSREEADAYIASVRAIHKDASHNVPAFIIGEKGELQWTSDDGEPQGTSGPPVLAMLAKEGLTNLVLVVTRYFGGIKLGTGGLVRAYTSSARMALDAAGLHQVRDVFSFQVRLPYTLLGKLQNMEKGGGFTIEDTVYTDAVTLSIACRLEEAESVKAAILELSSGGAEIFNEESHIM